jgi:beta-alanine degradation protein BauB
MLSSDDPTVTDPDLYKTIFENDRVRVLEYRDRPGDRTHAHRHPDSVMYTLTSFRRRISDGDRYVEVEIPAGTVRWVGAQEHSGENTGDTETHTIFVELKDVASAMRDSVLGPQT